MNIKLLETPIQKIVLLDSRFYVYIQRFLSNYYAANALHQLPVIAAAMPQFVKTLIYSVALLIVTALLKLVFPYHENINLAIYAIILIFGLSLAGIYVGFLQLMFS